MTSSIDKLTEYFSKFPGIGARQAKRFVYFLLNQNPSYLAELSKEISTIKTKIKMCEKCMRYFNTDITLKTCSICSNKNRDEEMLMIVEKDVDLDNMEKSGYYKGFYFVLGGSVPILDKEPQKRVRIKELASRIESEGENIKEIILSMNLTPEGENTIDYLKAELSPLAEKFGFKISTLGRGLSTGTEIEYSDKNTIKEALENRR